MKQQKSAVIFHRTFLFLTCQKTKNQ